MTAHFTQSQVPASAWLLGVQQSGGVLDETVCVLSLAAPLEVVYADATPADTLPALTPAVAPGPTTQFDPTSRVWLAYTIAGSNVLSLIQEIDVEATLSSSDYAVLGRILRLSIAPYQQS